MCRNSAECFGVHADVDFELLPEVYRHSQVHRVGSGVSGSLGHEKSSLCSGSVYLTEVHCVPLPLVTYYVSEP